MTVWILDVMHNWGKGPAEIIEIEAKDFLDAATKLAKKHPGIHIVKILGQYDAARPEGSSGDYRDRSKGLSRRCWGLFGEEFSSAREREFTSCITRAVHEAHPTVRIVPPEEFHQVVPAFSTDQVGGPAFREQIAPLGIRYLIFMNGRTVTWWQ